jgi:hypothetical protein
MLHQLQWIKVCDNALSEKYTIAATDSFITRLQR